MVEAIKTEWKATLPSSADIKDIRDCRNVMKARRKLE